MTVTINGPANAAASSGAATATAITDDTTTAATVYLTWVTAATGNLPLYVSSTKLTWNASTAALTHTGGAYTNTQAVAATSTDGVVLATSATATSGNQKYSPRLRFRGSYFSGSAKTTDWTVENLPTASGGVLSIQHSDDGGAYAVKASIDANGFIYPGASTTEYIRNQFGYLWAIGSNGFAVASGSSNIFISGSSGFGYNSGQGGTVTQASSRTTGVTLNKVCGAITLVSAAGSTSWKTFTVTNSNVAATDVVIVNQKSGADLYMISVTAVAAGSFNISFATTGGTTTEQPVFSFAVIKGVTS